MVHKKYTYKDGKRYGPYLYKTKRVDGRVVTTYLGRRDDKEKKSGSKKWHYFLSFLIGLIFLSGIVFFSLQDFSPTSRVTFDIRLSYEQGEPILGDLKFNIKEGEFIPKDAKVFVIYEQQPKVFSLEELVIGRPTIGSFFAEDTEISGEGEGYGVLGTKVISPTLNFDLLITEKKRRGGGGPPPEVEGEAGEQGDDDQGDDGDDDGGDDQGQGDGGDGDDDGGDDQGQGDGDDGGEEEDGDSGNSDITGDVIHEDEDDQGEDDQGEDDQGEDEDDQGEDDQGEDDEEKDGEDEVRRVISDEEYIISGEVSKDNDFEYDLEPRERAKIVKGSVKLGEQELPDSSISLDVSDNIATVSTEYFISEKGYGEEFLGDYALTLNVNMRKLDLYAAPGKLVIQLVYNDEVIASQEEEIFVEELEEEISNVTEGVSNLTLIREIPVVRIPLDGSRTLNLGNYFSGARRYEFVSEDLIKAEFKKGAVRLSPKKGFRGAAKGKIIAYSGRYSLKSNEFTILVSSGAINITTSREKIVVGEKVKWRKNIFLEAPEKNLTIELPESAGDIVVKKIEDGVEQELGSSFTTITGTASITGEVTIDIDLKKQSLISKWFKKLIQIITGRAISVEETAPPKAVEVVIEDDTATKYVIEYTTDAPNSEEAETANGKIVTIFGPDDVEYTDVIASASLSNRIPVEEASVIQVYWLNYDDGIKAVDLKDVDDVPDDDIVEEISDEAEGINEDEVEDFDVIEEGVGEGGGIVEEEQQVEESNISESPPADEEIIQEENMSDNATNQDATGNVISGDVISVNIPESETEIAVEEPAIEEPVVPELGKEPTLSPSTRSVVRDGFTRQVVPFDAYDLDGDGNVDYLEWVVPHLSNQTFEIIVIIKAEHLDSNRTFISDIFEEVKTLDGIWSETIPSEDYVRITFEIPLDSTRDITVYPRTVNGTPRIEVYEIDKIEIIAEFTSLSDNEYNKVFLTNLQGSQDTFDLRVLDGDIEFDHIVDPADTLVPNASFVSPTPANASTQTNTDIFVNLSTADDNGDHYAFVDFDDDVFLWMRMDDTNSSGDPTDLSSYSNNGTLNGDAFINSTGYWGNGGHFDGVNDATDDYIVVSDLQGSVFFNDSFSVSMWVRQVSQDFTKEMVGIDSSSCSNTANEAHRGWVMRVSTAERVQLCYHNGTTRAFANGPNSNLLTSGVWRHVVAVYDSSTPSIQVYHDAVAGTATTTGVPVGGGTVPGKDFRIGATDNFNRIWNGSIDEVLIFNRSLTAAEISALYNASATQYENNFTGLSESTHTFTGHAVDLAGNKNDTEERSVVITTSLSLSACGTLDQAGSTYNLTNNILSNGTCFTVSASNITLDGAGFTVTGNTSGFGINATDIAIFTLKNITVSNFTTSLDISGISNSNGGNATIIGSNLSVIESNGLGGVNLAGDGGVFVIEDSNISTVNAYGGRATATLGAVHGGFGGNVTVINSRITNLINVSGGGATSVGPSGNGGDAGIVIIQGIDINLTSITISLKNGLQDGGGTDGQHGKLTLNYSGMFDDLDAVYSPNISVLKIINSTSDGGEILFLPVLDTSSLSNLSTNVKISDNFVFLNSTALTGLNVSANITLYGSPGAGFSNPEVKRDGATCASSICFNFTALDAATVIFNVSYWTNYSIGESTALGSCGTLGVTGTTYTLTDDISATGTCFTVTADDITLDGNGNSITGSITGDTSGFGVDAKGRANFVVKNIKITNFSTSVSVAGSANGADGGDLNLTNSTLDSVDTNGKDGVTATGGNAGDINIFESNVTNITATGGTTDILGSDGANGGNVKIENTDINLTNSFITINGLLGIGGTDGQHGKLTLNYSGFFEDLNANYGTNLSLIIINSTSDGGEIKWLIELDSSGITNLSINTEISDNLAFADGTSLTGLNVSANITLYGTPGAGLSNPELKRDGATCASSICSNFTSLTAATVIFNVSYWTNYSIGEDTTLDSCVTLGVAGTTYTLTGDITATGTCFTVTKNDIILDGAGFSVTGNGSGFGADAEVRANFTVQNIEITNFSTSVSILPINIGGASGGDLTVINSSLGSTDTSGRDNPVGSGGAAGNINIFESNITTITALGGTATGLGDQGGDGGNVVFENTDINLTNSFINIGGGNGNPTSGAAGTLTLNYSGFFEELDADYGTKLSLIIVNDSSAGGQIKWLVELDSSGITNLSTNTEISDNLAFADGTSLTGLNVSANITLYGLSTDFVNPKIFRDGSECDASICHNFTSLNAGTVVFNVTGWSEYTIRDPCLSLSSCTEGGECSITSSCVLHSGLCTDSICNFTDFTINATLSTLADSSGDGNDLVINFTGNISFLPGNSIVFSGRDRRIGGKGGIVNITTTGLFNRTNSSFTGVGGFSKGAGNVGGDGGTLQINYHGLIGASTSWTVTLTAGNSSDGTSGTEGSEIRVKDSVCPIDADIDNDGRVRAADYQLIDLNYNTIIGDAGFNTLYDINCDGKLNVIDISKIGFEFNRGSQ